MLIIGHRGAKGLAPENTIESFKAALKHKVDAIELDVRVSADNVPVLVHDPYVLPEKGSGLVVATTKLKDLKTLDPDLATLDEALRFIKKRRSTPVVIEIKPGVPIGPIAEVILSRLRNGWKIEDISISSFDPKVLAQIKTVLPEVRLVINEAWSGVRATHRARKLDTKYITINQRWLWSGFIKSIVKGGYKLSVYTLDDPAKAKKWQKSGLYAAITDFPDRFKKS